MWLLTNKTRKATYELAKVYDNFFIYVRFKQRSLSNS